MSYPSCSDGVLRLWGRGGGGALRHLQGLRLHQTLGSANAFSPDGNRLISVAKDGSYTVLDVRRYVGHTASATQNVLFGSLRITRSCT